MLTRKLWNYAIEMKEGFMQRKGKVYSLSRQEREKIHEFISEQLIKEYISSTSILCKEEEWEEVYGSEL